MDVFNPMIEHNTKKLKNLCSVLDNEAQNEELPDVSYVLRATSNLLLAITGTVERAQAKDRTLSHCPELEHAIFRLDEIASILRDY